jgi:hypothetical protein
VVVGLSHFTLRLRVRQIGGGSLHLRSSVVSSFQLKRVSLETKTEVPAADPTTLKANFWGWLGPRSTTSQCSLSSAQARTQQRNITALAIAQPPSPGASATIPPSDGGGRASCGMDAAGREHTSAFYCMQLWIDRFSRNFSIISVRQRRNRLDKESSIYVTLTDQPLSPEEVSDIAELRLALISLALKPAHRHLSPADFDNAYDLAKRLTRINNAKDHFEYNRQFWNGLFSKA